MNEKLVFPACVTIVRPFKFCAICGSLPQFYWRHNCACLKVHIGRRYTCAFWALVYLRISGAGIPAHIGRCRSAGKFALSNRCHISADLQAPFWRISSATYEAPIFWHEKCAGIFAHNQRVSCAIHNAHVLRRFGRIYSAGIFAQSRR